MTANPVNATLLARLPALALPDSYLAAGCLYQSVWNALTGRAPTHGIDDYDVVYFDDTDLSWEAEDAVIRRCDEATADMAQRVEVRNQARVHLWYPEKFGTHPPPLRSSAEGVGTYPAVSSCFAIRCTPHGEHDVCAPYGFDDLFEMVVRPNPVRTTREVYEAKTSRWAALWPELTILQWDAQPR